MRKQVTGFFQKGLCGILSAAMILTSAAIPELSVFAAQPAVEETAENADGTPSKENNDAVRAPDAGEDDAAVVENGAENDASGQDDESSTEVSGGAKAMSPSQSKM